MIYHWSVIFLEIVLFKLCSSAAFSEANYDFCSWDLACKIIGFQNEALFDNNCLNTIWDCLPSLGQRIDNCNLTYPLWQYCEFHLIHNLTQSPAGFNFLQLLSWFSTQKGVQRVILQFSRRIWNDGILGLHKATKWPWTQKNVIWNIECTLLFLCSTLKLLLTAEWITTAWDYDCKLRNEVRQQGSNFPKVLPVLRRNSFTDSSFLENFKSSNPQGILLETLLDCDILKEIPDFLWICFYLAHRRYYCGFYDFCSSLFKFWPYEKSLKLRICPPSGLDSSYFNVHFQKGGLYRSKPFHFCIQRYAEGCV